jgi:hypothetical protein
LGTRGGTSANTPKNFRADTQVGPYDWLYLRNNQILVMKLNSPETFFTTLNPISF